MSCPVAICIMEKCAYPNKILVFPHRDFDGFTKGRYVKKIDTFVDSHPRHKVVFNPDLNQLFGHGWILDNSINDDSIYQRFVYPDTGETASLFEVGCGHCKVCLQNHAFQWKVRLLMERQLYKRDDDCCFLTLDYNDLFVPRLANGVPTLRYNDVSVFMRRLRDSIQAKDPQARIRFFCAGEYGGTTDRPHNHLILYGYDFFKGAKYVRKSRSGHALFCNSILDSAWSVDGVPRGGALFGEFSEGSAMYTAQYCVKKLLTDCNAGYRSKAHIVEKGVPGEANENEIHEFTVDFKDDRVSPYIRMSRNPGLGHDFIVQHKDEILANGGCYLCGQFFPISRYMMKVFLDENVPGIYSIDFDRRRLLKDRAERLDTQQQLGTDMPLWKSRRVADEAALSRNKIQAKMKGGF